jgi:hypothetical protein
MKEEELEFMSVEGDENYNNLDSSYVDPSTSYETGDNVIGNWIFNQSKVYVHLFSKIIYYLSIIYSTR